MSKSNRIGLLLLGVALLATLMRPPIAIVGPLLGQITNTYQLDSVMIAALNSLPLLCFGLGAFLAPKLERQLGMRTLVIAISILLTLSIGVRGWTGEALFIAGTLVLSICISLANVLLPTLVRMLFPNRIALVTGLYVTVMAVSASLSALAAVPSAELFDSWQVALSLWSLPGFFAIAIWVGMRDSLAAKPAQKPVQDRATTASEAASTQVRRTSVYRQARAWLLVAFFAIQSLGFYAVLGWLAPALVAAGMSEVDAGATLALATGVGIPLGLVTSSLLHRVRSVGLLNLTASALALAGLALFAALITIGWPNLTQVQKLSLVVPATLLLSFGQAVTFPIALSLISMKAASDAQTTQLSSMAQGVGYSFAFVGSFAIGFLGTEFGFPVSFGVLSLLTLIQLWLSWMVARPGQLSA